MPVLHTEEHPMAGHRVTAFVRRADKALGSVTVEETEVVVEDWADRVWGDSWGIQDGNPTAMIYAIRVGFLRNVEPNAFESVEEVVYVKSDGLAMLVHDTELGPTD